MDFQYSDAAVIGTVGLILDILGVVVLTVFSGVFSKFVLHKMNTYDSDDDPERKRLVRNEKISTYTGLSLLVIGFIMQAIALWAS